MTYQQLTALMKEFCISPEEAAQKLGLPATATTKPKKKAPAPSSDTHQESVDSFLRMADRIVQG